VRRYPSLYICICSPRLSSALYLCLYINFYGRGNRNCSLTPSGMAASPPAAYPSSDDSADFQPPFGTQNHPNASRTTPMGARNNIDPSAPSSSAPTPRTVTPPPSHSHPGVSEAPPRNSKSSTGRAPSPRLQDLICQPPPISNHTIAPLQTW